MSIILYINGQRIDTDQDSVIAQTKQVNDINSIDTREANYTNSFKVPKTANNMRAFGYLTATGNISNAPYQKNECSLYSAGGECFVYKGWANITDDGKSYRVAVYDGIIDLFKAIDNKSLAYLDLSELNHVKNVANVINTWNDFTLPYRYILADYNGNTGNTSINEIEIDYLVPSVNVEWLWKKIFEKFGFEYSGAVFNTWEFKNLWMTFPKGVPSAVASEEEYFNSADFNEITSVPDGLASLLNRQTGAANAYYMRFNTASVNLFTNTYNQTYFRIDEPGQYRITISGKLITRVFRYRDEPRINPVTNDPEWYAGNFAKAFDLCLARNSIFLNALNSNIQEIVLANSPSNQDFTAEVIVDFLAAQYFAFVVRPAGGVYNNNEFFKILEDAGSINFSVSIKKIENTVIDFSQQLSDFSIKDFMKEVVTRFGLTMFPEKYTKKIEFLTLQETLQTPDIVDWSDKFSKVTSESYTYGNYAQRNYFRYNYNDKERDYNDGYIDVDNVNLSEKKDIIKSKIYSPEREQTLYLNRLGNVYKLWDKEIDEGGDEGGQEIRYKALDKRYYFLRAGILGLPPAGAYKIKSTSLIEETITDTVYIENFYQLSFTDILFRYYDPIKKILNRSMIVNAEMYFTELDILNFDFRKLYYIKQLSNYFLVNKINNYIPGKITKVELIRVFYKDSADYIPAIDIEDYEVRELSETISEVTISYVYYNITLPAIGIEYSTDQVTWNRVGVTQSPADIVLTSGTWYIRVRCIITQASSEIITVVI